ncbi:hypothetical protein BB561_004103 [Smittium simulii]|uniref:Cytochrome b-c1 complex subunit 8 n=1 Tax=Smittium simulii TaxID=133385 RepID=A0A2T9YHZ0_9FUNG|nr:hypothetical protein BB561_004103 [Smittium simulii]
MLIQHITWALLWFFGLVYSQESQTFTVKGSVTSNGILPDVSVLSTEARISLNGGESSGYLHPNGQFFVPNVELGQHLLEIESNEYVFPKMLLRIERIGEKATLSAWYFQPGYEVNTLETSLPFPLNISPIEKRQFITRSGYSVFQIFKSPYMILVGFSLIFMFIMPQLKGLMSEEDLQMRNQILSKPQPRGPDFSATLAQMTSSKKISRYSGSWGNMKGPKERGFVSYRLSPFQLKAMKGYFSKGPSNVIRRSAAQVAYILPGIFLLWGVTTYGNTRYEYLHSKAGHHEAH